MGIELILKVRNPCEEGKFQSGIAKGFEACNRGRIRQGQGIFSCNIFKKLRGFLGIIAV